MNSDASDARKERSGRGERRYLRLGRESSMQLPGDESWLDELDDYEAEGEELNDEEVRRLVGTVLEDWDEDDDVEDIDRTVLDLENTPRAAKALGGGPGVREDAIAGAEGSESSIWDESDAFWSSSTPPSASHLAVSAPAMKSPTTTTQPANPSKPSKKRMFTVAQDEPSTTPQESPVLDGKKHRNSYEVKCERKRSALGDGSPNVNGGVQMTPGAYYDEQGFLRV